MHRMISVIMAVLISCSTAVPVSAAELAQTADVITIGGLENDTWFTKYGNVYTDCSAEYFINELDLTWGDLAAVSFLDQELLLPVIPTYSYVESGEPAIILGRTEKGQPEGNVALAINMGNFGETYGLARKLTDKHENWYWEAADGVTFPVTVSFQLSEKEGYMAEYLLHDLHRTNIREDYSHLTDADFANFREITTSGLKKGVLYRTSSPINPELGRNVCADNALEKAGVTVIMNLADDQKTASSYENFQNTYYSEQNVIYLNLGVDFASGDFQAGLAKGLRFLAQNQGIYAIHCTEGKDRAGFVSALLECLTGASWDEVLEDYMQTYRNYYGIELDSDKYRAIAQSNIVKTFQIAFDTEDLSHADLSAMAADYIRSIGLTEEEIQKLKENLCV